MSKKLTALLLTALLLCGCAPANTAPREPAAESVPSAPEEPPAEGPCGPAEDPEPEGEPVWRYPMGTAGGITAELAVCTGLNTAGPCWLLHLTSRREDTAAVKKAELLLNGSCSLEESVNLTVAPDGERWICLKSVTPAAVMLGENVSTLRCSLEVQDMASGSTETLLFEGAVTTEPEIVLRSVPLMGAHADEQILKETDSVRVTLLFLGTLLASNESALYGLVRVENLSRETIPYDIPQIILNGVSISPYVDLVEIPAGMEVYSMLEVSGYNLNQAGITEISSVRLQMMTDYGENTGSFAFLDGGSWYDVALDAAAAGSPNFDMGTVIFSENGIEIGFLRVESPRSDTLYWQLAVTNRSGSDISLSALNTAVNGEPRGRIWLESTPIGNDASAYRRISWYNWDGGEVPELSFFVQVFNDGRGRILYTAEEPTVIAPRPITAK